ncbi:MAG: LysM peptidoglycan-binding domain-containing protein [Rhizobacter sp.]
MSAITSTRSSSTGSTAPADTPSSVRIERGDTLSGLAREHGTTVQALLDANPQIHDPDLIFAGDRLQLPGRREGAPAQGPAAESGATLAQLGRGLGSDAGGWMAIARGETGQREVAGSRHNPRIVEYHQTTSLKARSDETPWCASFVNWSLEKAGVRGTDSAAAISWASWGGRVDGLRNAHDGDVVVIRNKATGQNHVGFFVSGGDGRVTLLGGNQSNQVKASSFGLSTYDIVAVRRPPVTH